MGWDNPDEPSAQSEPAANDKAGAFESELAGRISFEFLREQRRARRWSVFFKFLAFAYVTTFLVLSVPGDFGKTLFSDEKVTALVDLQGVIAHGSDASADIIVTGLRAAFEHEATSGVILRINSPGGSPVQSGYINDEIYRLREKYPEIPLYAVIVDICASGGYYVAAAADEIYADKASIVGSIGVRMDSFGFVEGMQKLGVERRLLTAGENKGFLDPFSPLNPSHVEHVQELLGEVHEQFVNTVRKSRRDKLSDDPDLFSGLFWTGERSLELGLIDAFGSSSYVAREVIGAEEIVNFTPRDYSIEGLIKRSGMNTLKSLLGSFSWGW
jgi:protease IV